MIHHLRRAASYDHSLGRGEGVEQRLAVGAAHQRVHQVLGMRHQAEHAQVGLRMPAMLRALPLGLASGVTSPDLVA